MKLFLSARVQLTSPSTAKWFQLFQFQEGREIQSRRYMDQQGNLVKANAAAFAIYCFYTTETLQNQIKSVSWDVSATIFPLLMYAKIHSI
ncbi:hypothetical protein B1R45_22505 [Pseudomonas azotoformans]|nr:hypothetical protein B1R45_22505 [Pseudomonas azotoformans]